MGKGVSFSHGSILAPYVKVDMKWSEVVKRVAKLISDDKWLTEADRETMESRDEVIPEPVELIIEEPPEKESLASRLVGYMKEFDPFGYADTLEIGETDEDAIKNIDEQLIGVEAVSWVCILGAAPFAAMGFFTYHQMTAEQFVLNWIRTVIIEPKCYKFESESLFYRLWKNDKKRKRKGG